MSDDDFESAYLRAKIAAERDETDAESDDGDDSPERKSASRLSREEVVERHRDLVKKIAHDIRNDHPTDVPFEDVEAYGYEGLLEAHDSYRPDKGVAFSSFAYHRIRGAILDAYRREGWATRTRDSQIENLAALNDHMAEHQEATAHIPSPKTLRDSIRHLDKMVGDTVTIMFLRRFDLEQLQITEDAEPHDDLDRRRKLELVRDALGALSENEHTVLTRHTLRGESFSSIAEDLDYSKSWLSRVNARAIDKIRDQILQATDGATELFADGPS